MTEQKKAGFPPRIGLNNGGIEDILSGKVGHAFPVPSEMSERITDHIKYLSMEEHQAIVAEIKAENERLREALRKGILWAECASTKLENRNEINWTYLNDAREALNGGKGK